MADSFRYPFRRTVNYLGAYNVLTGKNALPVLESQQFEASGPLSYSITVTGASVTLNGQSVSIETIRRISVTGQSVALTGQSVTLKKVYPLTASGSSVSLSAQSTSLEVTRLIAVTGRAVSITPQSVTLKQAHRLTVSAASVSLTGQEVTITYTPLATVYTLTVEPGAIVLTGNSVTLTKIDANATTERRGGPALGPIDSKRQRQRQQEQDAFAMFLVRQAQERIAEITKEPEHRIEAAKDALEIVSPVIEQDEAELYSELLAKIAELEAAIDAKTKWQNQLATMQLIGQVGPFLNALRMRRMDDDEAAIITLLLAA